MTRSGFLLYDTVLRLECDKTKKKVLQVKSCVFTVETVSVNLLKTEWEWDNVLQ